MYVWGQDHRRGERMAAIRGDTRRHGLDVPELLCCALSGQAWGDHTASSRVRPNLCGWARGSAACPDGRMSFDSPAAAT